MTAPPMSNASGTASGPGGSPPPRVWKRANRSASSRRKISPACAVSMCALSTTRRAGAAAPARPTTLTDVPPAAAWRRNKRPQRTSRRNDHAATIARIAPGSPPHHTPSAPSAGMHGRATSRRAAAPARRQADVGDPQPAHPFTGALRRVALGVRAGETGCHARQDTNPLAPARLAIRGASCVAAFSTVPPP